IARLYGVDGDGRAKEIDRLIELFGMKDFIRELTEAYSHGMKQRLVLAATLLHQPKVIMVEEPLLGLAPHTARLVKQVFREQARGGTSIFMSTHVLSVAEDFADRIGIMLQGKIVALGKMDDLRRQAQLEGKLEDVFFKITEGAVNPYERRCGPGEPEVARAAQPRVDVRAAVPLQDRRRG